MLKFIDEFLNKTTMYRLTLYCAGFLWILALVFSIFGILHYSPVGLVESLILIFAICAITNEIFAKIYDAPSNRESVYITAFILSSIIAPLSSIDNFYFLALSSVLAMASKYVLAINKKHIFNPAAIGVVLAALLTSQAATWWMGTVVMAPFVLIAGLLICRKIKKFDLFLSFIVSSFIFAIGYGIFAGQNLLSTANAIIFDSPMLYLGSIMLTEPMTTPPQKKARAVYGALVGFLNAPFVNVAGFYFTPEIALAVGNIFSFIASPKEKLILKLKEKVKIAKDTYNFVFSSKLNFQPGQYLEWTLAHEKADNRGIRRYFTIASSPTENEIMMGVKFYENPSSYKKSLISLNKGGIVVASQLAGDFILPKDKNKKLIFIAGGIGVTPFRSMIKYLLDKNEKRDIIIFYSNKSFHDIAYKEIFDQAAKKLGIKVIYCLSDSDSMPPDWEGETGFISEKMMRKYAPDFEERMFYISGPRSMILTFKKALTDAGIRNSHVKTDFFPGFA
ncbi:MAG: oxidoreductase [Candidatus Staskawiczbacteria bacterium]|jgi:ferredoxin-NADP reductase/Na+-translocating ferredoxin:NAD+ oxidoreductase RnfD subunit